MRHSILMTSLLVATLAVACRWQPPEPAMVIAGEAIARAELACPDRLSDGSETCHELERLKTRRLIFDRMLAEALSVSGLEVGAEVERQVAGLTARMEPSFRRHATVMRCHALAALQSLGEPVADDPACGAVDQRQVEQLVQNLSRRELRELITDDLVAKMAEAQSANLRAEASFGMVRDHLRETGRDEREFWTEVYQSLDPRFYDARLEMGPAEVITGDPTGWSSRESS